MTATATALSGSNFLQPGSLNGYTDVSFFETALDMVAPTLSNDVTLYSITAASGCATFPAFKFYDGSNGYIAVVSSPDLIFPSRVRMCVCALA